LRRRLRALRRLLGAVFADHRGQARNAQRAARIKRAKGNDRHERDKREGHHDQAARPRRTLRRRLGCWGRLRYRFRRCLFVIGCLRLEIRREALRHEGRRFDLHDFHVPVRLRLRLQAFGQGLRRQILF